MSAPNDLATASFSNFIKALFSKRVLNLPRGCLFKLFRKHYITEGLKFHFPKKLCSIRFCARFYYDNYEKNERTTIHAFVKNDDRVIELGGCIGVVSCITNKILKAPQSKHLVVEANPYLIPCLYKNRMLNDCDFIIENCTVGTEQQTQFYVHALIVGGSSNRETSQTLSIVERSLEELEKKHGPFNVLIMDIEGGELQVITNFSKTLEYYRLLVIEFHPFIIGEQAVKNCQDILKNIGFRKVQKDIGVEAWIKE